MFSPSTYSILLTGTLFTMDLMGFNRFFFIKFIPNTFIIMRMCAAASLKIRGQLNIWLSLLEWWRYRKTFKKLTIKSFRKQFASIIHNFLIWIHCYYDRDSWLKKYISDLFTLACTYKCKLNSLSLKFIFILRGIIQFTIVVHCDLIKFKNVL